MAVPPPPTAHRLNGNGLPVLVVSDVFPPRQGGSGRWLWELYRRLPQLEPTVLAGSTPGDAAFDAASTLRIRRFTFPAGTWGVMSPHGAMGYWRSSRQLKAEIANVHPRAIHCGKCLPEGLVALIARGRRPLPVWCFAHGEELTLAHTSRELTRLTAAVLTRASGIVANSQHTRGLLIDQWHVDAGKISVITPGVDTTRFVPAPRDEGVRARFGWTGRCVILTVGALQKRKGQDMLIRALPEIRRRCPDVLYAIAGEGWEHDYLAALARELRVDDLVSFMGIAGDADLVHAYQQCDLFALPNRRIGWDLEGFGIVLIEAQACGRPVVTGASGGTAETLLAGQTGEIVSCEEPHELAVVCGALLADAERLAAYGARAREWAVEQFDWQVLARRAAALFLYS
ncbi:MAG: glycosyltransferase family 4 protein [Vicinamibacterales bacterium]